MEVKINCCYDALVAVGELKPHPKNRNKHPKGQIERLAKIIEYQGWRSPIKVSRRSGYITAGHGRLAVALYLGVQKVPVDYQDYDSEEQEYADLQADNAIAMWSELDFSQINADLADLGPFDLDLFGIRDFVVDPIEKLETIEDLEEPKNKAKNALVCPSCGEVFDK